MMEADTWTYKELLDDELIDVASLQYSGNLATPLGKTD